MRRKAGGGALFLMAIVLVFQTTVLPDTLGLKTAARVFNAFSLIAFVVMAGLGLLRRKPARMPAIYVIGVLLVVAGMGINIARYLSPESVGSSAALLPWLAALAVPLMKSFRLDKAWLFYYRFMLVFSIMAAIEYSAVFAGQLSPTLIETDRGFFMKGIFTIFFGLDDGTPYYRMYSIFAEPGTFAMFLLPALLYAWIFGRRWAIPIFLWCFVLTDSLGGYFSLAVLVVTYLLWKSSRRPARLLLIVVGASIAGFVLLGPLQARYEEKQASRTVREDNVTLFRENLGSAVRASPFGMPLTGKSLSELENINNNYLGSNFEVYTVFVKGGVLALVGYVVFLVWVAFRTIRWFLGGERDPLLACAFVSLLSLLVFVFQRDTIFASPLFAYLFSVPLIAAPAASQLREAPLHADRDEPALEGTNGLAPDGFVG